MSEMDDPEASYRRGYYQGSWDVIEKVLPFLSPWQRERLEGWHAKRVFGWRYHNKKTRRADGHVTLAIIPPREYLRLKPRSN